MIRIPLVDIEQADHSTKELLGSVKQEMGTIPNIIATMANSPAVAGAYLVFNQALAGGALGPSMREKIALVVSERNNCEYCVAAHTLFGQGTGLTELETVQARQAKSASTKEEVVLEFVVELLSNRGVVADADVANLRQAGWNNREISEIVANVSLNMFTNYFNLVAGTELDFPLAPTLARDDH